MEVSDLGRIGAFTDGVFAIAITLLVLSFDVPQGDHELTRRVLEQWPDMVAYFLSFAVVGRFWIVHHRFFQTLRRADSRLVLLNMLFLSFVVLVPYTTQLLGDHGDDTVAAVVYATVLGLAGLCNLAMMRHALNCKHVREEARPATEPFAGRMALTLPVVFFGSIPFAFISPHISEAMWAALFVIWPVRSRLIHRTLDASETTSS